MDGHYLYIHVPFCEARCPYCDFFTYGKGGEARPLADRWLRLIERELELWLEAGDLEQGAPLATVYFGGGTPSLISPEALGCFVSKVRSLFAFEHDAELTMEMQPGTADEDKVAAYAQAGINRFSVGVQTFSPRLLALLERRHTVEDSLALIDAVRRVGRWSIDLMTALPGQSLGDWERELENALALEPEHLSVYELTYYRGTRMTELRDKGLLQEPDEEARIRFFALTRERLCSAGYEHYEISNYARPGARSRHNENYWRLGNYVGLGAGAHSFVCPHRYVNSPDLDFYATAISEGRLARQLSDPADEEVYLLENLFMGLRLVEGVDLELFSEKFGVNPLERFGPRLRILIEEGLLEQRPNRLRLTPEGLLRADAVISYLVG